MSARPTDPQQRADALRRFFVIDAPQEQPLQRVTRLASLLFGVTHAALVTIDSGDRRLAATQGFGEGDLAPALRQALLHPVRGEKIPLHSEDAADDPRFVEHPLLDHVPARFYASAPLKSAEGYTLGVLKVFDAVPRDLSDDGLTLLTDLAAMAESELNAQRQVAQAEARAERTARLDAFARAVGKTAERFLRADDWQHEAAQALQHLGEAVGAQAVQVYVNHTTEGRLAAERSFAWSLGTEAAPAALDYHTDGLVRWAEHLSAGTCLCASHHDLPAAERAVLDRKQARGMALAPLFVNQAWAGFLSFDFAREALALDEAEEEALRAAAEAFGAVLERDRRQHTAGGTALLDEAPTPLVVVTQGVISFANPAAERLLGRGASNGLAGTEVLDLLPGELHADLRSHLNACARQADVSPLRARMIAPGRQVRMVDLHGTPTSFQGTPAVLLALHDVTAHEQALRTAAEARTAAEEGAHLVSTLMTGLNQEVRTPLTSIVGYTELLAASLAGADLEHLHVIRRSGQQLSRTIEAVYELAQLGGHARALTPEPVPLGPLLIDAERTYASLAQERGLRFLLKPPSDETAVLADRRALTRVLGHLLANAVAFTDEGYVEVRVRTIGVRVQIEIEDTGCGMTPEFLAVARMPFRRGPATAVNAEPGAGLGLTLADLLVERMNGHLDLQSHVGRGTLCRIALPLHADAPSDYRPAGVPGAADGASVATPVPSLTLPSLAPPVYAR
ncbi:MAG: ATP-binding protein [Bacteroidota bacterium]